MRWGSSGESGSARTGEEGDGETAQLRNHRELGPTGAGVRAFFMERGVMVLGPGV